MFTDFCFDGRIYTVTVLEFFFVKVGKQLLKKKKSEAVQILLLIGQNTTNFDIKHMWGRHSNFH